MWHGLKKVNLYQTKIWVNHWKLKVPFGRSITMKETNENKSNERTVWNTTNLGNQNLRDGRCIYQIRPFNPLTCATKPRRSFNTLGIKISFGSKLESSDTLMETPVNCPTFSFFFFFIFLFFFFWITNTSQHSVETVGQICNWKWKKKKTRPWFVL